MGTTNLKFFSDAWIYLLCHLELDDKTDALFLELSGTYKFDVAEIDSQALKTWRNKHSGQNRRKSSLFDNMALYFECRINKHARPLGRFLYEIIILLFCKKK